MSSDGDDWWTLDDIAQQLNVRQSTLRAYLTRHEMPQPDRRLGKTNLWRPDTIVTWTQQRPRARKP